MPIYMKRAYASSVLLFLAICIVTVIIHQRQSDSYYIGYFSQKNFHFKNLFEYTSREPNSSVKIAFGLMAHNQRTVFGLMELVDAIYSKEHLYVIHIDEKVEPHLHSAVVNQFFNVPNIIVVLKRHSVDWGGFSIVKAELELLTQAVILAEVQGYSFDYFFFADGATYPLVKRKEWESEIASWPVGSNIVFSNNYTDYGLDKPTCYYFSIGDPCGRTPGRCIDDECTSYTNTPQNMPIYKGYQWVFLSREFVNYLYSHIEWFDEWIRFFENTWVPDESFFQTLLLSSPLNNTRFQAKGDMMYTNWGECHHYKNPRPWGSPCFSGLKDLPHLKKSKALFHRKFLPSEPLKYDLREQFGE